MLKHDCTDCKHDVTSNDKVCIRCGHKWASRVENPKACPNCKSAYWNKTRRIKKIPIKNLIWGLSAGESIIIPWPGVPYQGHPADRIVNHLNYAGGRFHIDWKDDGAHVSRGRDAIIEHGPLDPGPMK